MSTTRTLKQRLSKVSRLWDDEDYDQALAEVEQLLETWPGNPHLHVLKASLAQLQEEPKYELDETKQFLQQAVELDKNSPTAAIELGHFLDHVEDDPRAAVKAYAEGVAAARHLLLDGLIGQAKAYRQLERKADFVRCLVEILYLTRLDHGSKGEKNGEIGLDVIVQSPSGDVFAVQVKGPYSEEVRELLAGLAGDQQTEPDRSRKTGTGR